MIIKRKLFSKDDNRDSKDKKWDSIYGSAVGTVGGGLAGKGIHKTLDKLGILDKEITTEKLAKDREDKAYKLNKENEKLHRLNKKYKLDKKLIKEGDIVAQAVKDINLDKDLSDKINDLHYKSGKKIKEVEELAKQGKKLIVKRKLKAPLIISGSLVGATLGSLYGKDNNLTKQRRKAEDAVGDKVAEKIKGI